MAKNTKQMEEGTTSRRAPGVSNPPKQPVSDSPSAQPAPVAYNNRPPPGTGVPPLPGIPNTQAEQAPVAQTQLPGGQVSPYFYGAQTQASYNFGTEPDYFDTAEPEIDEDFENAAAIEQDDSLEWVGAAEASMNTQATDIVADIRAAYAKLKNTQGHFAAVSLPLFGNSETEAAVVKSIKELGKYIDKWATVYREWAIAGKRSDDGGSYNWARWLEHADVLKVAIEEQGNFYVDSTLIQSMRQTYAATKRQIEDSVPASNTLLVVGAGLAAVVIGIAILRTK